MLRLFALLTLLSTFPLLAGCQTVSTADVPGPNFNAPPVAMKPVIVQPAPRPLAATPPPTARNRPGAPRDWTPVAAARPWRYIVIHHSATPNGSVGAFDRMHKQKGWDECGYHFVIGNGDGSGDGQIEVGPRWPKQKWGAHAKTPDNRYNDYGIGICLVGNFDNGPPTARQQQAVARLVAYLMQTYRIAPGDVVGHKDTGKSTACPGRNMNVAAIRRNASAMAGSADIIDESPARTPVASVGAELLHDAR